MRVACLDLGSNSFHLEHLSLEGDRVVASLLDEKRAVALGRSVFRNGGIDREAWQAGITAFDELVALSQANPSDRLVVVATSAIRRAGNGRAFLNALNRRSGVTVELLAPEGEARLSYLGALGVGAVGRRTRTAVADVGGGSAELTVGEGLDVIFADSLPLGVLRVLQEAKRTHHDGVDPEVLARSLKLRFGRRLAMAGALGPAQLVLASGTARSVRKLAMWGSTRPGKTGMLTLQTIQDSLTLHRHASRDELQQAGVDASRVDTVLAAHAVLIALMDGLGVDSALVIDGGLRHGLAVREARRRQDHSGAVATVASLLDAPELQPVVAT